MSTEPVGWLMTRRDEAPIEKESQLMTARFPVCTTLITLLLVVMLDTDDGKVGPESTGSVVLPTGPAAVSNTKASAAITNINRRANRISAISSSRIRRTPPH